MVAPTITPAIIRAVKKFLKDKETKKRKKKVSESRKAQRIGLTRKEKVKKHKESFKKYGMREKYTLPGDRNIFGPAGGGVTTRPEIQERDKRRKKVRRANTKNTGDYKKKPKKRPKFIRSQFTRIEK